MLSGSEESITDESATDESGTDELCVLSAFELEASLPHEDNVITLIKPASRRANILFFIKTFLS